MNYYELLEVAESASIEVIRAAYKAKIKQCHPDNFQKEEEKIEATKVLQKLNKAIEVLTDEKERELYDKKLYSSDEEEKNQRTKETTKQESSNQTEQFNNEEIVERVQYMITLTRSEQEYLELHQKIRKSSYSEMEKILMSEVLDQITEQKLKSEIILAENIEKYKKEVKDLKNGIILCLVGGFILTNWFSSAFFIGCVLAILAYLGGGDDREQVKMSERANEHILKYRLKGFRI